MTSVGLEPAPCAEGAIESPPSVVGAYRILQLIGQGGMGAVYEAEHMTTRQRVAIKFLHRSRSSDALQRERSLREAVAMAAVQHPNLTQLFGFYEQSESKPYLVMELIRGESLRDRLRRLGKLPLNDALRFAQQAASALSLIHQHEVIHRDIKPENLMIVAGDAGEQLKILDFGIAKLADEVGLNTLKTSDSRVVGTPTYMSPEQCQRGEELSGKSDVYGLGVTLYELLTGRPPFTGEPVQLLLLHLHQSPPPLRRFRPELSLAVEELVLHMLAKSPARRPTMAAVADALRSPLLKPRAYFPSRLLRGPLRGFSAYHLLRAWQWLRELRFWQKALLALFLFWIYWNFIDPPNAPAAYTWEGPPRAAHLQKFREKDSVLFFDQSLYLGPNSRFKIHVDVNVMPTGDLRIYRSSASTSYSGAHLSGCIGIYDDQDQLIALRYIRRCGVTQSRIFLGLYDWEHPRVCLDRDQSIPRELVPKVRSLRLLPLQIDEEFPVEPCARPENQQDLARRGSIGASS